VTITTVPEEVTDTTTGRRRVRGGESTIIPGGPGHPPVHLPPLPLYDRPIVSWPNSHPRNRRP